MRIGFGWGCPPEEAWPDDGRASSWPPTSEPPGIDELAGRYRVNYYRRVLTIEDCKALLDEGWPVLVSFDITDDWFTAPRGLAIWPTEVRWASHVATREQSDSARLGFSFFGVAPFVLSRRLR
jgi:hypothetical protein